jgi:hypothetical protein
MVPVESCISAKATLMLISSTNCILPSTRCALICEMFYLPGKDTACSRRNPRLNRKRFDQDLGRIKRMHFVATLRAVQLQKYRLRHLKHLLLEGNNRFYGLTELCSRQDGIRNGVNGNLSCPFSCKIPFGPYSDL